MRLTKLFLPAFLVFLTACAPQRAERLPQEAVHAGADSARPALVPKSAWLESSFLVETQARRFSTEFTFTNGNAVLKIEAMPGLGREDAQRMIEDGVMGVQALYANALAPYPGDISNLVVSENRFRPESVSTNWNGQVRRYLLLFANARLGYGATTADVARHRSLLGWFYCPRGEVLYKVRCFLPLSASREELEKIFLGLECP